MQPVLTKTGIFELVRCGSIIFDETYLNAEIYFVFIAVYAVCTGNQGPEENFPTGPHNRQYCKAQTGGRDCG
jgi:hypothetical protein